MRKIALLVAAILSATLAYASVFGTVRAIVHDPQHRPIHGAKLTAVGRSSGWSANSASDQHGIAQLIAVPIGEYAVKVEAPGFAPFEARVRVLSDNVVEIHTPLRVAAAGERVEVHAEHEDDYSSTPQTSIQRADITEAPGADRANSLAFITNFVPSAAMVHDQLHVRGGHQVTWAVDGVPIPNTNIASNVGPQFDPKDVEYVEAQRGGFMADYGDRTYGVFNVAPRSGFERNRLGELQLSYGSFHQTDDYLSFGDHTEQFAWYASLSGNRTDYGLEPPTYTNLHNQSAGGGAFTSLTWNRKNGDQFRFVGAGRADFYQVPNDPEMQDSGVRDREREQDSLATLTYLHPFGSGAVLTLSPFFHFNRAAFEGGPEDVPSATTNRASWYSGGQATVAYTRGRHNARAGFYGFAQRDNTLFSLVANEGSGSDFSQRQREGGNLEAVFVEDQYRPFRPLVLTGGVRVTRFAGSLRETAASPRVGVAYTIPQLGWVLRATYSRFYQAPPLNTLSGPLLEFANEQGVAFLPLRGERDEQHDFGLTIPFRGWSVEIDNFRTGARNFFDHDALGNSNIFFPLTIDRVRIRGTEVALRSPRLFGRVDLHLAYSHQSIEGEGATTGGLTDFEAPQEGSYYLDHDQRNTLAFGGYVSLPWHSWTSFNVGSGSGFLDGDGPGHLPAYATVDLALGKSFGERWSAKLNLLNVGDVRYFIDRSNTFGGSHVNDPRQVTVQVRYQFHY